MINSAIRKLPTTDLNSEQVDTRELILRVALKEFSKFGVDAVKLSHIRDQAGLSNRSGVHYHFKTKDLLVVAVTERVQASLNRYFEKALHAEQASGHTDSLEVVVRRMFTPFVQYFMSHKEGSVGLRFLSRLTWQTGQRGQDLLRQFFTQYLGNFDRSLRHCLPTMNEADLRFKLYLAVNTAIHGIADYSILLNDEALEDLFTREDWPDHLNNLFMNYITGGLRA
ncbi:MAG: TetR family transcriptional regulator [Limnobacter sp.]|nr:TetR family transcriptional regulator [Limnobacter sp.]